MEEDKIPSRSDRHKKEKSAAKFFHFDSEIEKESKDNTASAVDLEPTEEEEKYIANSKETVDVPQKSQGKKQQTSAKRKKRRNLSPAAGFFLLFVMLCSGAWCGYAAMSSILPSNDVHYGDNVDQEMLDNVNVLVLGCDEREGDSATRADVIMMVTVRPEAKQISVFSIPRDTRVEIKGHGKDKINHSMAYGGIPLIQSTVENLLKIKIDHTVKVNFDGFINVIDALGGINIDVPCRMYKPLEDIDLLAGYQTLSGSEALAFVRWRGDGTGDYGRIERQQQFLSAVSEKVKDMSLTQALNVVSAVMDSIDTDMSIKQMTSYGINLLGVGPENFKTYSFVGEPIWLHGVSYVEPDMEAIAEIVDKMQHGEPEPVTDPVENGQDGSQADTNETDVA